MDSYVVEVQTPAGLWIEISHLVDVASLGGYSYGIEDSLLQFRTGDISLTLHNDAAGTAAGIFNGADPSATYRLRVARNGLKLFEGVIALPGTLNRSDDKANLEVNAFGYLALLDKISAENVRRSFSSDYVTGTVDTNTITFGTTLPTRFLQVGDVLRIANDTRVGEVEVLNGNGGSTVTLKDSLANTWLSTDGNKCKLLSVYWRRVTIPFLVQRLFLEAGIGNPTIDLVGSDFSVPVGTPINTDGLDPTSVPYSMCEVQGKLRVRYAADGIEMESLSAADGNFLAAASNIGGSGTQGIDDWHCYQLTEPAMPVALPSSEVSGPAGVYQIGGVDYASGAVPRVWAARIRTLVGGPGDTHHYELRWKDWNNTTKIWGSGTTITVDTPAVSDNGPSTIGCDFDPINGWVYFCYKDLGTTTFGDIRKLRYYDIVAATLTTIKSGTGADGELRYSREAKIMLHLSAGDVLTGYNGLEVKFSVSIPTGALLRTARYMPVAKKWVIILQHEDRTKLLVADKLWTTQSLLDFSDAASVNNGSGLRPDDSENFLQHFKTQLTGVVNGQFVVVDTMYAGVVSYADFEGHTVAGALIELAKLMNCVVWVDNDFGGYFVSRGSRIFNPYGPKVLDSILLTQDEALVWDKWFGRE